MSFDTLAPFYRAMEFFTAGGKLQRCRVAFLGEIPMPRKILIAGEGHGRFLPECVKRFPDARIVVVDFSAKMLEIARSKVASDRVEFVHADFLELVGPSGEFDLIVTNFFLDCFVGKDLALVVAKLGKMAAPRADWLLADFEIAPEGAARWRSRIIVGMLYRFFRAVAGLRANQLCPPDEEITKAGFARYQRETYDWGLLKSEWWRRGS
ncbi:MAG: class I SAM-dependent methyltransferase [Luteolibacter sp.]|uniref:class I SAM-dependent methyltransferase n=1 Tax=Luteolibacter sp. TaxID=1962973 RepID=UPI0032664758